MYTLIIAEYSDFSMKVTTRLFHKLDAAKTAMMADFTAKMRILDLLSTDANSEDAHPALSDRSISVQNGADLFEWRIDETSPVDSSPCDNPEADVVQIRLNLIRECDSENAEWSNAVFLKMAREKYERSDALDLLRSTIQDWLKTPDGWNANRRSSFDYNWGDFIEDFPDTWTYDGITVSLEPDINIPIASVTGRKVNQDEHLAPWGVSASFIVGSNPAVDVVVDMTTGRVYGAIGSAHKLDATNCSLAIGSFFFPVRYDQKAEAWTIRPA